MSEDRDYVRQLHARWDVGFDPERALAGFKDRVLLCADETFGQQILGNFDYRSGLETMFSALNGSPYEHDSLTSFGRTSTIRTAITHAESFQALFIVLQNFFRALEMTRDTRAADFATALGHAIDNTYGLNIRAAKTGKLWELLPAGDSFLDAELVDDTIRLTAQYPKANEALLKALTDFLARDERRYRDVLNNLRIALEELTREILGNQKSLEKQTGGANAPLGRWLKDQGVHPKIRSLYVTVFDYFTDYQNDASKHDENWSSHTEVEFVIYLTASLIRLLAETRERERESGS